MIDDCTETLELDNAEASSEMDERSKIARQRIRKYMKDNNINPANERGDLPVSFPRAGLVKVSGSAHIASGKVAKRWVTDLRFRLASFR